MPLYFLKLRGTPPGLTGLLLAPMGLDVFLALPIMGRLSEHYGARIIPGGGATIALMGTRPFALGDADMPLAVLAAAYSSVPCGSLGHATTAINICQRFGGPVGITGLAIFLQHELAATSIPVTAFAWTFWLLAGLAVASILAASQLPGVRSRA